MAENLDVLDAVVPLLIRAAPLTGKQNLTSVPHTPFCFPSPTFKWSFMFPNPLAPLEK